MSALAQESFPDGRPVMKCECGLVQFATRNNNCRRCHKPYQAAVVPEAVLDRDLRLVLRGESAQPDGGVIANLGPTIRILREANMLTQADLAGLIGLRRRQRSYVSKVERGGVTPKVNNLERFGAALGTPVWVIIAMAQAGNDCKSLNVRQ